MSKEVKLISDKNKRKDWTDLHLSEWRRDWYYLWDSFLDEWIKVDKEWDFTLNIETIDYADVSIEDFMTWFEVPSKPCIINGATSHWSALNNWNFKDLIQKYGETNLRVGEDDKGYALRTKLADFIEYLIYNRDDSPLYLFESNI